MKRHFVLTSIAVSTFVLAGCGTATPTTSPSALTSSSSSASPTTSPLTNAVVYFVGDTGTSLRLYSENADVAAGNSQNAAVQYVLSGAKPKDPDYVNLWPAGSTLNSVNISGDTATVDLTFDSLNVGAEAESRALEQLMRTIAASNPTVTKVQFMRDGKVVESFAGHVDTSQPISIDEGYESLATVDIDLDEGNIVSSPVSITGLACTFEANVPWELSQNGKVINSGSTTAAEACPVRSVWKVDLGELAPGTYQFRTWESSMKDGSLINQDTKTFTVK